MPNKKGTRVKYSKEVIQELTDRVAAGEPLTQVCKDKRMPERSAVYNWFNEHPDFLDMYVKAKELQSHAYFDRIIDISQRVLNGDVEANSARVAMDALKWVTARLNPRVYNEKYLEEQKAEQKVVFTWAKE